jgi:hypothetical protein
LDKDARSRKDITRPQSRNSSKACDAIVQTKGVNRDTKDWNDSNSKYRRVQIGTGQKREFAGSVMN